MQRFSVFRRKLAHRLQCCATRRRDVCCDRPSGADLKAIQLFERLAVEADTLPQSWIDAATRRCADPAYRRRFEAVWDTLPDVIGILVMPQHACDLVRWMLEQADHDPLGGALELRKASDTELTRRCPNAPIAR